MKMIKGMTKKEYERQYRQLNSDHLRQKAKEYREKNPEKIKQWQENSFRRKALKMLAEGLLTKEGE